MVPAGLLLTSIASAHGVANDVPAHEYQPAAAFDWSAERQPMTSAPSMPGLVTQFPTLLKVCLSGPSLRGP